MAWLDWGIKLAIGVSACLPDNSRVCVGWFVFVGGGGLNNIHLSVHGHYHQQGPTSVSFEHTQLPQSRAAGER